MISVLQEASTKDKNIKYAFLDIRAAYDSVDRTILWEKCAAKGIDSHSIRVLKEFFDHNTSQVSLDGFLSEPFLIRAGVLQGSVLSPFLYSIFIDDLPRRLDIFPKVQVNSLPFNCLLYADDIVLVSHSTTGLQQLVNACQTHAYENRFTFNTSKCVVLSSIPCRILINSNTVAQESSFRYLGVEFSASKGILVDDFVNRRVQESISACRLIRNIGMNCRGLSMKACSLLYKCFIRSKLESSMCIMPLKKKHIMKIESAQQQMMSMILGVGPSSSGTIMRSILCLPRMKFRLKWLRTSYCRRFASLPSYHYSRRAMAANTSFVSRLCVDIFQDFVPGSDLRKFEMSCVHSETAASTNGHLIFPSLKQPLS